MAVDLNGMILDLPARRLGTTETIDFTVAAGKDLKIETSPDGATIASGTVLEGKVWTVKLVIHIDEADA